MKQPRSFYRYDNKDEDNFLSNDRSECKFIRKMTSGLGINEFLESLKEIELEIDLNN